MSIADVWQSVNDFWDWLKLNDAPNWFVIFFSLIAWPIVLGWWFNRTKQNIPNLEVAHRPSQSTIGGALHDAVAITFTNRTGSIVYLSSARLKGNPPHFPASSAAAADISGGWRALNFCTSTSHGVFDQHECILHTRDNVAVSIAVERPMNETFYAHQSGWLRRFLRCKKYYVLEYTAMVGETKYSVRTIN